MPAARASWLALPVTNEPNVNVGLRLPGSARRFAKRRGVAAGAVGRRGASGFGSTAGVAPARAPTADRRLAAGGRVAASATREFDRERFAGCLARQRLDAAAEAVLDPLQHEAVRGDQAQARPTRLRRRAGGSRSRIAAA